MSKTVGEKILDKLKSMEKISQEDFDFVKQRTSFLFHMNVLNTDQFTSISNLGIADSKMFWLDISSQFPKGKRHIFWKLFLRVYVELSDFYFIIDTTSFQRHAFDEKWINLGMMVAFSEKKA